MVWGPRAHSRGRRFHLSLVTHSWSCVGPAGREARPLGQVSLPGEVLHGRAHTVSPLWGRRVEQEGRKGTRVMPCSPGSFQGSGPLGRCLCLEIHTPPQPPHQQPRPAWVPRFRWSIWEPMKRQEGGGSEPAGREGLNHVLRVLLWAVTHLQTGL